jgi:hypothetical protein
MDDRFGAVIAPLTVEGAMQKLIGMALLIAGLASRAFASPVAVPEIDGATAVSAITLVTGAVLVMRGREK